MKFYTIDSAFYSLTATCISLEHAEKFIKANSKNAKHLETLVMEDNDFKDQEGIHVGSLTEEDYDYDPCLCCPICGEIAYLEDADSQFAKCDNPACGCLSVNNGYEIYLPIF